jgi:hypothetical protein
MLDSQTCIVWKRQGEAAESPAELGGFAVCVPLTLVFAVAEKKGRPNADGLSVESLQ